MPRASSRRPPTVRRASSSRVVSNEETPTGPNYQLVALSLREAGSIRRDDPGPLREWLPRRGPADCQHRVRGRVTVSCLLGLGMLVRERSLARMRFAQRAADIALRVEQSVNTPIEQLYATTALMQAQPSLDQNTFHRFARPLLDRHKSSPP